jgi:1-acyl-sn-glycerol-3-phosphate acyltransferase
VGKQNYKQNSTYVIVANHQSYADIFAINQLYRSFKWVSKKEIYRFPVVGWVLYLSRYITLERENKKSILKMYKRCGEVIDKGISIVMFPEGTRSKNGKVKKFKTGAFHLALEKKVNILPIVIHNSYNAYPLNGFRFKPCNIKVRVLPEIEYETFKNNSLQELAQHTENIIREAHEAES